MMKIIKETKYGKIIAINEEHDAVMVELGDVRKWLPRDLVEKGEIAVEELMSGAICPT